MSNYSLQYKEYYDRLKKKYNTKESQPNINYYDRIPSYRGNIIYTQNKIYKKESFFGNIILMQLVGTIILFLFAFGGKYSSNKDIIQCYSKFKAEIEEEYTYNSESIKLSEIKLEPLKEKFLESINWIKDIVLSDDFIY